MSRGIVAAKDASMKKIRFDFNNMMSSSVGSRHGVTPAEKRDFSARARRAQSHLSSLRAQAADRIRLGLEWVRLPYQSASSIDQIQSLADQVSRRYEAVLFLGIGGSYLGLKAAQDALLPAYYNEFSALRKGRPRVYFEGNNLDPSTLTVLLDTLDPLTTFVVVISKSGETTETKAAFMVVEEWLRKKAGKHYGRQILVITDPHKGSLRARAEQERGRDPLSFRTLPLFPGVGGRFSEFNMGLFHLAVTGIPIAEVLAGARAMDRRCAQADIRKNPACQYALLHTVLYARRRKSIAVLMPFSESLKSTADWYVQLLSESLGKKYSRKIITDGAGAERWEQDRRRPVHRGRTPLSSRGTNDLHSIQQNNVEGEYDKVVTFITVERFPREIVLPRGRDLLSGRRYSDLLHLAQEATAWALVQESRPNCSIILPQLDPYHWGGLLYFFEMATAFEGEFLEVNAFDQPGVEGYKQYMYVQLGKKDLPAGVVRAIKKHPLKKDKRLIL